MTPVLVTGGPYADRVRYRKQHQERRGRRSSDGRRGFVDTFGVLSLGGVFTANMTGNTVLMGVYAFVRQGSLALHSVTIALALVSRGAVPAEIPERRYLEPAAAPSKTALLATGVGIAAATLALRALTAKRRR